MRPIFWLLLAIAFGAAGLVESWLVVNLFLPLASSKPGIVYYTAEDRVSVDLAADCDAGHSMTDTIPLDPPHTFNRIQASMLLVCDRLGEERKWIYTIKTDQDIRDALDHIEQLALWRDRSILGGLGLLAGLPIVFCLAAAVANLWRSQPPPIAL